MCACNDFLQDVLGFIDCVHLDALARRCSTCYSSSFLRWFLLILLVHTIRGGDVFSALCSPSCLADVGCVLTPFSRLYPYCSSSFKQSSCSGLKLLMITKADRVGFQTRTSSRFVSSLQSPFQSPSLVPDLPHSPLCCRLV